MKTEIIQKLLYLFLMWLVQYLDGWHLHKNGGKKKAEVNKETVTMNTEGKVVE